MKTRNRSLRLELLQRREMMTVESLAWDGASSLRLSFVPDGTPVADQVSNADQVFSNSAAGSEWHASVAKAFEIWAQYAAINVGVVSDSGDPMGVRGPVRGDARFGEVRVAGIAMSSDTWAAAVNHDKLSAGTWAGDLLFNTAANWDLHSDDLLKVAFHEAGHVLGLPHNSDPASPMHEHGIPSTLVPASSDIALLRQLYGLRQPDANEINKPNDAIGDATRIRFSDSSSFDGSKALVHYGEISSPSDRDIFFFELPSNYNGTATLHAVSAGLSQLQFRFAVTDRHGVVLAQGESMSQLGGDVALDVSRPAGDTKLYLQVEPIGDPLSQVGSYAIIAQLDGLVETSYEDSLKVAQTAHRWFASSAQSLTNLNISTLIGSNGDHVLVNDGGVDDNPLNAPRVEPYADSPLRRASLTIGTISTTQDVDYFRFRSPKPPTGKTFGMLVNVDALELDQLVPVIQVLDKQLRPLAVEQFVNGNGNVVVWVPGVRENEDYTVRVAGVAAAQEIGNYELAVTFQENKPQRNILSQADLTQADPESESTLYVARPQLFTLALKASSTSAVTGEVWANIYDDHKRPVTTLATEVGQLRTGASILLMPGTYYLQFGTKMSNAVDSDVLKVELSGNADSDPLGPPRTVGSQPVFSCPDSTVQFCYPDTPPTTAPFAIVPTTTIVLPTSVPYPVTPPANTWFWNNQFPRTNFTLTPDTSGDGQVSPRDALIVINHLNALGSGLLPAPPVVLGGLIDVNADGHASPIDALLVINYLNRQSGTGEGEATQPPFDFSQYLPEDFLSESSGPRKHRTRLIEVA
ncbi:MAG: dockerin type I domain-containing protein [Pirellulaceae bacterium]|nr:dockerin type I domain-containing protein [Pirellulaceae bacterium]